MSEPATLQSSEDNPRLDALMRGVVDPHVHSGPSTAKRALDHLELARKGSDYGYAAVITKDHDYSGVATSALIRDNFPELTCKVYSGIVLNSVVGGFNAHAVEHTAKMGGKIVWMPTLAAENHFRWQAQASFAHPGAGSQRPETPMTPIADGVVKDEVKEILDIIAESGMTLASGHLHVSEIWKVFEEAKARGVQNMILTHPEEVIDASLNDVRGLMSLGAYVEHSLSLFLESSKFKCLEDQVLKAQIEAAGVDRTVICSDLGQFGTVDPVQGMRDGIALLIRLGYCDEDIRQMTSSNAADLFGLGEEVAGVLAGV